MEVASGFCAGSLAQLVRIDFIRPSNHDPQVEGPHVHGRLGITVLIEAALGPT